MKILLLIIFFSTVSCGMPKLDPVERCSIYLETSKCRCHMYDFTVVGGNVLTPSVDHPIKYCDRSVVFRTDKGGSWQSIIDWRDELILWLEDK